MGLRLATSMATGRVDLVVAECDGGAVGFLGNGDGTFQYGSPIYIDTNESNGVVVADVNGDGKLDVLSTDGTELNVHLGNGDGTFQTPTSYQTPRRQRVYSNRGFQRRRKSRCRSLGKQCGEHSPRNGNGTFQNSVSYNVVGATGGSGAGGSSIAAGDFKGNGILDLVVATQSGVNLLFGNGDGTFQGAVVVGSGSNGVAAADINGDGKLDIVSAALTSSGGLIVSYGNGNGTFQAPVMYGRQRRIRLRQDRGFQWRRRDRRGGRDFSPKPVHRLHERRRNVCHNDFQQFNPGV